VASDGSGTTAEDTPFGGQLAATDVDNDPLTFSVVAGPAHGTVVVNAGGTFTYTPAANYNGPDSFTFKANDGTVDSNVATFALTVSSVNDAPEAADDSATTDEDAAVTIPVLANDTDVDGDALRPVIVTGPSHGTLTVNTDGTVRYTPNANYNGTDSFTYKANDGSADSNVATVTLAVRSVNDAPAAANDSYSTGAGVPLTVPAAGVLANDTDADGDALSAVLVGGPANGTLTLNPNGSFTYTPAAGFAGTDTFTYKANDGSADSNVATVTVQVAPAGSTEGKVTGSGTLAGSRRFAINVLSRPRKPSGFTMSGTLGYTDGAARIRLVSTAIKSFQVDATGKRAVITGTARVNGRAGYTYTVTVEDLGEPGTRKDTFRIVITGPTGLVYDSGVGLLTGGNLQVHKKA
jgi:VCBS repeat-containing protein